MSDRQQISDQVHALIQPLNKKGIAVTDATRFAQDLELDSLTVLDFVAMNMQAEIETVGQLIDALVRLTAEK